MAVAGGTAEAFMLRLDNGRLVELGKHRPAGHLITTDVDKAAAKLRRGESVYLEAKGMNLSDIKEQFKNAE